MVGQPGRPRGRAGHDSVQRAEAGTGVREREQQEGGDPAHKTLLPPWSWELLAPVSTVGEIEGYG